MIKKTVLAIATSTLFSFSFTSQAAVWQDPSTKSVVGNICQGVYGWQVVPPRPVGATCFSPAFGHGVIASW